MTLSFSFWILCRIWEVPSDGITQAANVMTKAQHPTFLSTEIIVVNASRVLCCSNDLSFVWKARYQIPHSCHFHPLSWCPLTFTCTQIITLPPGNKTQAGNWGRLRGQSRQEQPHLPSCISQLPTQACVWARLFGQADQTAADSMINRERWAKALL